VKRRNLKLIVNFVFLNLIVILSIFSYYLISAGFESTIEKKVTYTEKSNVDYKVYYHKNNFFDMPYIEKDKTYISSLIDYIDIQFDYKTEFSGNAVGEYTYHINGTITASNPNNENEKYWTKTVNIVEPQIIKFNDKNSFDFLENVKIDYQLYNNLLKEFKSEYNLAFAGNLKIELFVEGTNKFSELSSPIKINSKSHVIVPLTQQTINLTVDYSNINKTKEVIEEEQLIDTYDIIFITIGSLLILISLFLLYVWFRLIRKYLKSQSEYNKEKRKILKTYNAIIVNVETMPKLDKIKIIDVKTFDELIDAQSEVRMPINFLEIKHNKLSKFILINDNIAWIYTLIDEEYKKKNN